MLEPIGEPAVRTTTRVDSSLTVEGKDVDLKKMEKVTQERPIESSQESTKTDSDKTKKNSAYNVADDGIVYEKYDKNGNVVLRLPPEQKPIDEHV
ncbi:MAG: hypothetical protein PVG51_13000 [Desulfosarcina sp.]|jgi:hypothetical protein